MFITFEGVEGSGKTSVLKALINILKDEYGEKIIATREPGGTKISEEIRGIILDRKNTNLDPMAEALLFAAARKQHLVELIIPNHLKKNIVLCDRFIDSSLVYQGSARELGVERIYNLNLYATDGFMPDLTLLFDIEPEKGMERIAKNQDREVNRLDLEKLEFHHKIRASFLELAKKEKLRYVIIDASKPLLEVINNSYQVIKTCLIKNGY